MGFGGRRSRPARAVSGTSGADYLIDLSINFQFEGLYLAGVFGIVAFHLNIVRALGLWLVHTYSYPFAIRGMAGSASGSTDLRLLHGEVLGFNGVYFSTFCCWGCSTGLGLVAC